MSNDSKHTSNYFEQLNVLSSSLAALDIALYSNNYNYLSFGSWEVVVGFRKKRWRIQWDGKEFLLTIWQGDFSNSRSQVDWDEVRVSKAENSSTAELMEQVIQYLQEEGR